MGKIREELALVSVEKAHASHLMLFLLSLLLYTIPKSQSARRNFDSYCRKLHNMYHGKCVEILSIIPVRVSFITFPLSFAARIELATNSASKVINLLIK